MLLLHKISLLFFVLIKNLKANNDLNGTDTISARNFNSACGDVFTKSEVVLETQGYPGKYPPNMQCSYLLKGPYCPTEYKFQFLDFNLESSNGCVKDRLEIDNKDALCGNKNGIRTYFSENGALQLKFVSDATVSGRGYRILISRSSCKRDPNTNTDAVTTTEVVKTVPSIPNWTNTPNNNLQSCCTNQYNSKRFILTSPNFPYTLNSATDCIIRIRKANPDICRIRFHLNFFSLGNSDCNGGFLQIDGKYLCGCNSDIKLLSVFQSGASIKDLRLFSRGFKTSQYSGFIIEVIQDECPKKYIPETILIQNQSVLHQLHDDQGNRVAWPNDTQESLSRKLHFINERTDVFEQNNKPLENIVKHVYFFASPDYNRPSHSAKDKEETDYIDLADTRLLVIANIYQIRQCLNINQINMNMLYARFGQNLPKCQSISSSTANNNNCVELNYVKGYFRSPYYPFYYPGNLNICYRFRKQPGYCHIRTLIQDFHLENSYDCTKDYLIFTNNRYRYCGNSLYNKFVTFDLTYKDYEEMRFVTDPHYCGKGFSGIYEQIACHDMSYPIYPVNPTTTVRPYPDTPSCSQFIEQETFLIEIPNTNINECKFQIKKYSMNVCKLELYFEKLDLPCMSDMLLIDGYRYCGYQSGRTVILNFGDENKVIVYRRENNINYQVNGKSLRIVGKQISDCSYPDVAPERIISRKKDTFLPGDDDVNDSEYLISIPDQNLNRVICGIITNTTNLNLPNTLCKTLRENNITELCMEIEANVLNVTFTSGNFINLNETDLTEFSQIEYKEVDCDEVNKIVK